MRSALIRLGWAILVLAVLAPGARAQRCPFRMNMQFMMQQRMMMQRRVMMPPRMPPVFRPQINRPMFVNRMMPRPPLRMTTFRPQLQMRRTMVPRMTVGIQRVTHTFRMPHLQRRIPPARPMIARGGPVRVPRPRPTFAARWNTRIHRVTTTRVTRSVQQTPRWQASVRLQQRRHTVQRPPVVVRRPVAAPARPRVQRPVPVNPRPAPSTGQRSMTQITARVSFQCGGCHSCPRGRPSLPMLGPVRPPLVMGPRPARPLLPAIPLVRRPVVPVPPAIFRPRVLPPTPVLVLRRPALPSLLPAAPLQPTTRTPSSASSLSLARSPFEKPGEIVRERPVAPIAVQKTLTTRPGTPTVVASLAPPPLPKRQGQLRPLMDGALSHLEAAPAAAPLQKAGLRPERMVVYLEPAALLAPPPLPSGGVIAVEKEEAAEEEAPVVEEPPLVESLALAPPLPERKASAPGVPR